ncbi:MAG: glycosyltransferase family 4 protein [Candidatus Edwardsbacteria bacterium]|nr:glycosyltransferase family 4 protein [Candidatus Edwardsbacteria bacterium]
MRICFVHQKMMSFVEKDIKILSGAYQVKNVEVTSFLPRLNVLKAVYGSDLVFCWFGKMPAFWAVIFARLLNKRSIVVAGGDDVANEPAIGYGLYTKWWKSWCPDYVFKHCDLVLSVSEFNRSETIKNTGADENKVKCLYHGFGQEPLPQNPRDNAVITVGRITRETVIKKGLKLFVRSASLLPDIKYYLIGPCNDGSLEELKKNAPPNIIFTGGLYGPELDNRYAKAKVYVQASYHESFGCSVAEAMLGGCIPVVSRRAALPEVAGDTGIYIEEQTPEAVAVAVKKALALPDGYGLKARQRIIDVFPLEKRKEALLKAVEDVMKGK